MPISPEFHDLLSAAFRQMADAPETPLRVPPERQPADPRERGLIQALQAAQASQLAHSRERQLLVEARQREQSALLGISRTLASALELKPGLILDQLRLIVDFRHAALFVLEEQSLVTLAVRGLPGLDSAGPLHIPLGGPEAAALFQGHQPQRIADVWGQEPAARLLRAIMLPDAAPLLEGARAWMWLPLAVKGRVIGGIGAAHSRPDSFTPHHADLSLIVANQAAIALSNAQLYEQAQTAATLQERQRLAQNLHDAVNQSLFSATLIAEVLPRLYERDADDGRQSLEDLRRLTRGAMAEMRGLLAELRPLVLTDSDLGDLMRQLGDALTGRTNVPVTVTVQGEGFLPPEVQICFYRLCQEGLINIAKHAGASRVRIDLAYDPARAELHIHDDGLGFDPARVPSGHHGLNIMGERAKAVGARLSVSSQPGQGTHIDIYWAESPTLEES